MALSTMHSGARYWCPQGRCCGGYPKAVRARAEGALLRTGAWHLFAEGAVRGSGSSSKNQREMLMVSEWLKGPLPPSSPIGAWALHRPSSGKASWISALAVPRV